MEDKEVCSENKEAWSFEKEFGFNSSRPIGPRILIQVYVKELSKIVDTTGKTKDFMRWESIVGRVCKIGSASYKGERFKDWATEELPKIGDWVTYRPGAGTLKKYGPPNKGVYTMTIFDDAVEEIVEDPNYIDRD